MKKGRPLPATPLPIVRSLRSSDGVRKHLLDANRKEVEAVVIPGRGRTTLCLSTQAGCPVACTFCATGTLPLLGNLSALEIVGQFDAAAADIRRDPAGIDHPLTNVVYMGMGEPFLNFDAVAESLDILIADRGFHSQILTVSTIGIPEKIAAFGARFPHVRLAVSLHAPDDETRTRLIPLNRRHPIADLLAACRDYQVRTRKKVFFEYVMIEGVTDSLAQARLLSERLRGLEATVNLIPLHPGGFGGMKPTPREAIDRFRAELMKDFAGHATFRRSRGLDIDAACGQLALKS